MSKIELNIDEALLDNARAVGLDVELLLDRAVRLALQKSDPPGADARARQWAEENAEAIEEYNQRITERGLIGDEFRKW